MTPEQEKLNSKSIEDVTNDALEAALKIVNNSDEIIWASVGEEIDDSRHYLHDFVLENFLFIECLLPDFSIEFQVEGTEGQVVPAINLTREEVIEC